jgi:hypothetical protein
MALADLLKKASGGEIPCPKCGALGVSLQNVRIAMEAGKPKLDSSAYGKCGKCDARIPNEQLQKMALE